MNFKGMKKLTTAFIILSGFGLFSGCTERSAGENSPRQRLADYISVSFAAKSPSDKEKLVGYLTGNAKARLSAWSEDQFRSAFVDTKRQFIKLTIREIKKINENETNVTYELSYLDQSTDRGGDARVTHKRLAEMVQENKQWYIRDVQNLRELIEYKDALTLP
jgi:hypothetical protein